MKTKIIIAIGIVAGCLGLMISPLQTQAQSRELQLDLNYSIGIPSGSFKTDAVDKASFRGWTANLLYNINDHISVGAGVGYQDFYQKFDRAVYKLEEGGDISAVLTNSIQTIPVLAQVQYRFVPNGVVQPYVGIGAGGNIVVFDQYLGEYGGSKTSFRFAARPQVGLFVPFRKDGPAGIHAFGSYNYMPYKLNGVDDLSNWGAGIGVKFPLR
jgi:opacity protein-like surface antigen